MFSGELISLLKQGAKVEGVKLRGQWVFMLDRQPVTKAVVNLVKQGRVVVNSEGNKANLELIG